MCVQSVRQSVRVGEACKLVRDKLLHVCVCVCGRCCTRDLRACVAMCGLYAFMRVYRCHVMLPGPQGTHIDPLYELNVLAAH